MKEQTRYYKYKLEYETDSADLFNSLENNEKVVVIDARKHESYVAEHIPGAINLWHKDMTEENTRELDRTCLYITYCDGIGCNASTRGALRMSTLGFQVKELLGGLDWWKRDGYSTSGDRSQEGTVISCGC